MSRKKCPRVPEVSPRPWKFIEKPRRSFDQWSVVAADGFTVATSAGPDSGYPDLDAQDLVNFRLISAAPELLAELKRIHHIVACDGGIACIAGCLVPKEIDRVIAKAEGRK